MGPQFEITLYKNTSKKLQTNKTSKRMEPVIRETNLEVDRTIKKLQKITNYYLKTNISKVIKTIKYQLTSLMLVTFSGSLMDL